jgi:hypothetical protein
VYDAAAWVLGEVRKAKALAKLSLRVEAERVIVHAPEERQKLLRDVERDIREAGNVAAIEYVESAEPRVEVLLPTQA